MSTIRVSLHLSRSLNEIVAFGFVLLLFVCASSSISADRRNVRFPEDTIIFPNDEKVDSKEKRSENGDYRGLGGFQHNPEFHKFHRPPPRFGDARMWHSPEYHKIHGLGDIPTDTIEYNNESLGMIPLDLIQNINKVDNLSEVLLNFVEGEEEVDAEVPFITDRFSTGERTAAVTPKSAACMPELQTVQLTTSEDASVLYIPQCTRIERCGGCCSHHLLSCQPTEVQPISFSVMKTQYTGGKKLKYVGKEIVVLEKHTKCKCDCKTKAEDCNRFQQYKKAECRCTCINIDEEKKCYRKNQTKLWDPQLCSCICREVTPCSTGFEFDPVECKCAPTPTRSRYSEGMPRIDYKK